MRPNRRRQPLKRARRKKARENADAARKRKPQPVLKCRREERARVRELALQPNRPAAERKANTARAQVQRARPLKLARLQEHHRARALRWRPARKANMAKARTQRPRLRRLRAQLQ